MKNAGLENVGQENAGLPIGGLNDSKTNKMPCYRRENRAMSL